MARQVAAPVTPENVSRPLMAHPSNVGGSYIGGLPALTARIFETLPDAMNRLPIGDVALDQRFKQQLGTVIEHGLILMM